MLQIDITAAAIAKAVQAALNPALIRPTLGDVLRETRLFHLRQPTVVGTGPNVNGTIDLTITTEGGIRSMSSPWLTFPLKLVLDATLSVQGEDAVFRVDILSINGQQSTIQLVSEPGSPAGMAGMLTLAELGDAVGQQPEDEPLGDRHPFIDQLRILARLREFGEAADAGLVENVGANPLPLFTGPGQPLEQLGVLLDNFPTPAELAGAGPLYEVGNPNAGPLAGIITQLEDELPSLRSFYERVTRDVLVEQLIAGVPFSAHWTSLRRAAVRARLAAVLEVQASSFQVHSILQGSAGAQASVETAGVRKMAWYANPSIKKKWGDVPVAAPTFNQAANGDTKSDGCFAAETIFPYASDVYFTSPCLSLTATLVMAPEPFLGATLLVWMQVAVAVQESVPGLSPYHGSWPPDMLWAVAEYQAQRVTNFIELLRGPEPPSWFTNTTLLESRLPLGSEVALWMAAEPFVKLQAEGMGLWSLQVGEKPPFVRDILGVDVALARDESADSLNVQLTFDVLRAKTLSTSAPASISGTLSIYPLWRVAAGTVSSATAWSKAYVAPQAEEEATNKKECQAEFKPVTVLVNDVSFSGFAWWQQVLQAIWEWFTGPVGGLTSEVPTAELEAALADLLSPDALGDANDGLAGLRLVPLALIPTAGDVLGVTGRFQATASDNAVLLGSDEWPFAQTITLNNVARAPIPVDTPGWPEGLANPWTSLSPFPATGAELSQLTGAQLVVHLDQSFGPVDPPFNIVPIAGSDRGGRALPVRGWVEVRYGEPGSGLSVPIWRGSALEATSTWMLDSNLVGLPLPDMGSVSSLRFLELHSFAELNIPAFVVPPVQTVVASLAQITASWPSMLTADVAGAFADAFAQARVSGPDGTDATRGRLRVHWMYRSCTIEFLEEIEENDFYDDLLNLEDVASNNLTASVNAAMESAPTGSAATHGGFTSIPLEFVGLAEDFGTEVPQNRLPPWWPVGRFRNGLRDLANWSKSSAFRATSFGRGTDESQ